MKPEHAQGDLTEVLHTKEEIDQRVAELAAQIDADYGDSDVLLVGVLKGAVMIMADPVSYTHLTLPTICSV